jgi:hypothetical protein
MLLSIIKNIFNSEKDYEVQKEKARIKEQILNQRAQFYNLY